MYKSEIEVKLNSPLKYSREGAKVETDKLILLAPSARHSNLCFGLKQELMRALKSNAESRQKETTTESASTEQALLGEDFINLLYMSPVVKMGEINNLFRELLLSGICLIPPVTQDKKQLLTDLIYLELTNDDIEKLMGEYFVNFLLSSILKKKS